MNDRHNHQAIGARCDAEPIIGHGVISSADRVHANNARTAGFDFADAHLDRVAVVVFSDAEQHEHLCVVPIGLTKFPERAAHRVDASRGHVHRTKPTVRGVVWRAEPLGPKRRERLRLIAACEERQFGRVFFANRGKPLGRNAQRFFP